MELLVSLQLEGGVLHGEHPEGGAATALGRDRGAHQHRAINTILVLDLKNEAITQSVPIATTDDLDPIPHLHNTSAQQIPYDVYNGGWTTIDNASPWTHQWVEPHNPCIAISEILKGLRQ